MTFQNIYDELLRRANPEVAEHKAKKFGIQMPGSLGMYQKDINDIAKQFKITEQVAVELIHSDIYEARMLGYKVFPARMLTVAQANQWVHDLCTWEDCDTFSMKLIGNSTIAWDVIPAWLTSEDTFVKRAAYATIAALTMTDKKADNQRFETVFQLALRHANDDRLYVKKGASWAFRSIGKRNPDLKAFALNTLQNIPNPSKPIDWIIGDVCKELQQPNVRSSNYPRALYAK